MRRLALSWTVVFAATLLGSIRPGQASEITIGAIETAITHGMVMLNADATIEFGRDATDALNSGIALVFELDLRIKKPRKFLWNSEIFASQRRYSIERHALSEQFVLTDLTTGERRIHGSLTLAIDDLGRIRQLPIIEQVALIPDVPLAFSVRLRLDIESLPSPMIPLAYISPSWHMSSGWRQWTEAP